MAMRARPVPIDPYNPSLTRHVGDDHEEVIRHPSPFIPIRVRVFALVIWINDIIVRMLNALGARPVRHGDRHGVSLDYKRGRFSRESDAEESAEGGKKYR